MMAVLVQFLVRFIPRWMALKIGSSGGSLCFRILKREKNKTLKHLGMVFENKKENYIIARNLFRNLGMNLIEWLQMTDMTKEKINSVVTVSGIENIKKVLAKGKGAIVVTAHFGNWEYISAYMAYNGYQGGVIARKIYYPRYDKLLYGIRKASGVETIWRDSSVRNMIRILKKNNILGVLPDQDTDKVDGIFINFLGYPAYTPTGPVSLALATGAGIVPCFIIRKKGKHYLQIEEPLDLVVTGNKEEDIKVNTEKWSSIFERYIRKYPDQWVWMHKRWDTKETKRLKGKS
jgi:KDO2-lipid IV(A) lauroyltransferase